MNPLLFTIPAALFLAIDSGGFYAESYPALPIMGYALSCLSYGGFLALSSRRDLPTRLVLIGFIVINTLSAAMGAGGEVMDQWERTISLERGRTQAEGLKDLSMSFSDKNQRVNAAKNADAYRDLVTESIRESKPLAWVKISLILMIRFLLEMTILIISSKPANSINKRLEPQSTERISADSKTNQPRLRGILLGEEKLKLLIKSIEEKGGVKFGNSIYQNERAQELLEEAKKVLETMKNNQ